MTKQKTIGIIGGVGPLATADFFKKLLLASDAAKDQDYPHILVNCYSQTPDRTKALLENGSSPAPALIQTAQNLVQAGAEILCLPCNTGHAWFDEIQQSVSIPIVNMITEVVNTSKPYKKVGVLATDGTRAAKLYDTALQQQSIELIQPNTEEQKQLMQAIYGPQGIKAGHTEQAKQMVEPIVQSLIDQGAEAIILGCTELPIVIKKAPIPLIDTNQVLAQAILARSK